MKRMKIKWKIMLCFTAMFVLIIAASVPIRYTIISNNLYINAKYLLQSEAERVADIIVYSDGRVRLDRDVNLIATGTYIAVYSNDSVLRSGELPEDFDLNVKPQFGNIYTENSNGHKWIIYDYKLFRNSENVGWLRAVRSLDATSEILKNFKSSILKIIPIYIVIAFLGLVFIRRTLSPVVEITKTAKQISQGNLTKRLNLDIPRDELGTLAETLDEMLDRLEYSFNREKRFSSDVSHELRTPITAIILSAEEALGGDKTSSEYKESLSSILKEGRRVSALISQLLMMARSYDGEYVPEKEAIDISLLTKTIVDELSEGSKSAQISISSVIEEGIIMDVEQTLFMRLLINLIDNAIKYNIPGGWVKVSLRKTPDIVVLSVEDSGIGISKDDLPKIWDRFFKVDQSSINASPGLGLPIVKWIAQLHGGTVHVTSVLDKGSLFEIRFKTKYHK